MQNSKIVSIHEFDMCLSAGANMHDRFEIAGAFDNESQGRAGPCGASWPTRQISI